MKVKSFQEATLTSALIVTRGSSRLATQICMKEYIRVIKNTFAAIVRRSSTSCHISRTTNAFTRGRNHLFVTCVENVLGTIQLWNRTRKSTLAKRLTSVASVRSLSTSLVTWEHMSDCTRENWNSCAPSVESATTPGATSGRHACNRRLQTSGGNGYKSWMQTIIF